MRSPALRLAHAAAFALALASLSTVGCGPEKPATVSFRMTSNVKDALVTIDDQVIGSVSTVERHGVALKPGQHRLTVEKPGYFPYDELVDAKDVMIQIQVRLDPVPD